ncbi:MAG: phosphate ABC transporter permease PstA [Phycisphaerales bacterium]|nr:phosphate ABC transporter permease PstA [Phycisphaerales bacterium]
MSAGLPASTGMLPGGQPPASSRDDLRRRRNRRLKNQVFLVVCIGATSISVAVLLLLLGSIVVQGAKYLDLDLLRNFASRKPDEAGIKAALWGSIWLCGICLVVAVPLGICTAIFLEEYKPRGNTGKRMYGFIQLNISNLAGVPSIVYGILGLTVFVRMFGLFGSPNLSVYDEMYRLRLADGRTVLAEIVDIEADPVEAESPVEGTLSIPRAEIVESDRFYARRHTFELRDGRTITGDLSEFTTETITIEVTPELTEQFAPADVAGYRTKNVIEHGEPESFFYLRLPLSGSVLAGGLTLSLVILPILIIASREALRAVPPSLREGAFALGSTRWQMIWRMILPASVPGIMTGTILAISRAIGEAAPLLVIGGILFIMFTPRNMMDDFAALPLQIYNWASRPQAEFHKVAASGIIVLLGVLLVFNAIAIVVRQKFQRPLQ